MYQWTDTGGQTHFSDTAPPGYASRIIELDTARRVTGGLRPAELKTLQAIEQRRQQRHTAAESARRKHRRARDARRQACNNTREKLRHSRTHAGRKALSMYLRKHCW